MQFGTNKAYSAYYFFLFYSYLISLMMIDWFSRNALDFYLCNFVDFILVQDGESTHLDFY